jgi:ribosomal protein L40E
VVTCSKCGCVNEDDVVFCAECFQQVKIHSKNEIARLEKTSLCPKCDYYNPIEETSCVKCGTPLRKADFVVTGKDGRESVIRDLNSSPLATTFLWLSFLSVLSLFIAIAFYGISQTKGMDGFIGQPSGKVFGLTILVMATVLGLEWNSGILYRAKLVTVFFVAYLALGTFLGKSFYVFVKIGLWDFNGLLLLGLLISLLFSIAFIVRVRLQGSVFGAFMAFTGLYCTLSPILCLFSHQGIVLAMQRLPSQLYGVPFWLGPMFLAYHVFLPYTLLLMIGSGLKALLSSMEKVDGTKSIARFLNRRKEEARGELLNIFVVAITLFTGFSIMLTLRVPNILSLFEVAIKRYL